MIRLAFFLALALSLACGAPTEPMPLQCGPSVTAPILDSESISVTTVTLTYCVPSRR